MSVTLDAKGEVADARVVSGPEELRKSALASVLNWHFAVDRPVTAPFEVSIRYVAAQAPNVPAPSSVQSLPPTAKIFPLDRIDVSGLPAALQDRVAAALNAGIHEGDQLTPERFTELTRAVKSVDEHIGLRGAIRNEKVTLRPFVTDQYSFNNNQYSFSGPVPPPPAAGRKRRPRRTSRVAFVWAAMCRP